MLAARDKLQIAIASLKPRTKNYQEDFQLFKDRTELKGKKEKHLVATAVKCLATNL